VLSRPYFSRSGISSIVTLVLSWVGSTPSYGLYRYGAAPKGVGFGYDLCTLALNFVRLNFL